MAEAACRERGAGALHLEVERENVRAQEFYRRGAFIASGSLSHDPENRMSRENLGIYLNDHLAWIGHGGGVDRADAGRGAEHRAGETLKAVLKEIEEDRGGTSVADRAGRGARSNRGQESRRLAGGRSRTHQAGRGSARQDGDAGSAHLGGRWKVLSSGVALGGRRLPSHPELAGVDYCGVRRRGHGSSTIMVEGHRAWRQTLALSAPAQSSFGPEDGRERLEAVHQARTRPAEVADSVEHIDPSGLRRRAGRRTRAAAAVGPPHGEPVRR